MFALFETIALIGSIALPMWNIPLVIHIIKRKSSKDISLPWALGVWVCILLMFPQALISKDLVWKTFSIMNIVMFSAVVFVTLYYRFKNKER